jgi:dTDP-4-dehydrorhamnose reductase
MNIRHSDAMLRSESVLVTGAEGKIAQGLLRTLEASDNEVWSTTRRADAVTSRRLFMDLQDDPERWSLPAEPVDVAFLCAAVSSQAQCSSEPERTRCVNVRHTVELAERLAAQGTFVVFISTNLVFDGETPFAKADDPYRPQTAYGWQKAEAERQLLASLRENVAIVRVGKVVVPGLPLFDGWVEKLRAGQAIAPYRDMVMAPVALSFVVDVLCRVAAVRRSGIVHATAAHDITYAEAAAVIARNIGADESLIESVPCIRSGQFFAPRYATLDSTGLNALGLEAPLPACAFDHFGGRR